MSNISTAIIKESIKWVDAAVLKSKSSSQFGRKTWDEMHGGGTSRYPHCRPFGLYNPDLKQYKVKFSACPSGKDMWLVEDFVIASPGDGVEPSKETVYAEIRKKLEDMLWPFAEVVLYLFTYPSHINTTQLFAHPQRRLDATLHKLVCCVPILDDLTRWHAAFLTPLPPHLSGVGDLAFAPGVGHDADLADPRTYTIRPLHSRVFRHPELEGMAFKSSTTSLPALWSEMFTLRHNLVFPHGRSHPDRDELWLGDADETPEDDPCDVRSFTTVSSHVRKLVGRALADLCTKPEFSAPCLARSDYAFRNVLLDRASLRVKAFIDWDDVHISPFVLALDFPEDITYVHTEGLDPNAPWFQDGGFGAIPPDEYGDIAGPFDANGNSVYEDENGNSNGLEYRDERILNTMYREAYVRALQKYDSRVGLEGLWELRKRMVQAHVLLEKGACIWWSKRDWLAAESERLENGIGR